MRYRFTPSKNLVKLYKKSGIQPVSFLEITDGTDFHRAMVSSLENNIYAAQVEVKSLEEYSSGDMRLFITDNRSAGFAIKQDGDIVSVFSALGVTPIATNVLK